MKTLSWKASRLYRSGNTEYGKELTVRYTYFGSKTILGNWWDINSTGVKRFASNDYKDQISDKTIVSDHTQYVYSSWLHLES